MMVKRDNIVKIIGAVAVIVALTGCTDKKAQYTYNSENIEVLKLDDALSEESISVEVIGDIDNNDISGETEEELNEAPAEESMEETDAEETSDTVGGEGSLEDDNKVDLIFFMGQSNMAGYGGDASKAPVVSEEEGVEYRVISDPTKLYPLIEPFGLHENNPDGLRDDTSAGGKKGSLVSAFVKKYHQETGHKVVAVSASVGGMAMDLWVANKFWNDCLARVSKSKEWLTDNNYTVEHIYLVWFQGESDVSRLVPVTEYESNFSKFMNSFVEKSVEQIFLIVPARSGTPGDAICDYQENLCAQDGRYTLGTTLPSQIGPEGFAMDGIHLIQDSLNKIGDETGHAAAQYTNSR